MLITEKDIAEAKKRIAEAEEDVFRAKKGLLILMKQFRCRHKKLDGSVLFGQHCLRCGLYMNDGGF